MNRSRQFSRLVSSSPRPRNQAPPVSSPPLPKPRMTWVSFTPAFAPTVLGWDGHRHILFGSLVRAGHYGPPPGCSSFLQAQSCPFGPARDCDRFANFFKVSGAGLH